jgi:hypothetical protein
MKTITATLLALILSAAVAHADVVGDAVQVSIVTDSGQTLPLYPTSSRYPVRKAYAEAVKGDHYRISIRNNLGRRVGVVVAVDGRNIISGTKSWLRCTERMYILEPYETNEYSGWRTGQDQVNRFYFTDVPDSYAAAFKDESALGVIAVAVYPEVQRYEPSAMLQDSAPAAPSPSRSLEKKSAGSAARAESDSAGTGYGRPEYSPSRTVEFEAEKKALETVYLKYEWRTTLCRLGIVSCGKPPRRHTNRLWDNGGYAPPPPGR